MCRIWAAGLVVIAACATSGETTTTADRGPSQYPPSPPVPDGPVDPAVEDALTSRLDLVLSGDYFPDGLDLVVEGGDPRVSWFLADLLRFQQRGPVRDALVEAFASLTGVEPSAPGTVVEFVWAFNHLLAWDLPAWDGYPGLKRELYTLVDQRWEPFFEQDYGIDWRWVTWGGVLADDRPLGDNGPCICIPSLDYPGTTDAAGGDWYPDQGVVFGVVVNDEALAMPRNQMEIHEMLNLTLGGRELGIPYCTLCGSAQAYLVDQVPGVDRVVLRTSGLLSRSNKLMYDLATHSAIDTFTGRALSGPLGEAGVVLEQVSVVATTWADWKEAHPDTRILAQDGGIGRSYPEDPLRGRDDDGPIFPVGDIDQRLPVQEKVVGVVTSDGTPIAFQVSAAREALVDGGSIEFEGVAIRLVDSLRLFDSEGEELTSHQAFWFAWSQFHPDTLVWTG